MHSIEANAKIINPVRDPTDQNCVYIIPGEPERETYRVSSFHHFPRDSPIDPRQFASNGFYYTGYRDRVKCFSCGQCAQNWSICDDITSLEWHKSHCEFVNGIDKRNVPIMALLRMKQSQIRPTSSTSSCSNIASLFNHLYIQTTPRSTQITSSQNTSSTATNNASPVLTQTQSSLRTTSCQQIPSTRSSSHTPSTIKQASSSQENNSVMFPCLRPINPHMRSREARLQTFLDNSSLWPAHRIRASPQQIVDAGMYYLGTRDRVKCWYCNGGLQNWKKDDIPWKEHAKWFPECEFMLKQKGVNNVCKIVSRYPSLNRPTLYNPASGVAARPLLRILGKVSHQTNTAPSVRSELTCQSNPRKEMGEINNHEMQSSNNVVQAVLSVPKKELSHQQSNSTNVPSSSPMYEMRRLENSIKCKKCLKEDVCMVFLPCGHLVCCVKCAENCRTCPICKEVVIEKIRSYIS